MSIRPDKILVVEPDGDLLEMIAKGLSWKADAHVTCVDTLIDCLDVQLSEPHDLVISDLNLPDGNGMTLAEQLSVLSDRPVILMGDNPTREDALAALRLNVSDLLCKPFPLQDLLDTAQRVLRIQRLRRRHQAKYHQMRSLVRRMIRERRDLSRRTDLICRDLVGAHKRLINHVLDWEEAHTPQT